MATTGYSGKPLLQKLGIKETMKVQLINAPADYFDMLETNITDLLCGKNEAPDFIHLFAENNKAFETAMEQLKDLYKKNTSLITWISWYKKSAGIATDLTEYTIRNYALKHDLVDVKVCAVSELWSGLKLVVRLAKR